MDFRKTIRLYYDYVVPSYKRVPIVFDRAKNTKIWDSKGKEYLDFFSGFVVSGVGHCNHRVVEAIKRQAEKLIHIPNSYHHEPQALLAETIIRSSFPGKVFFANSGTEAVEAALKLARKYGSATNRTDILTMNRSFHGRTYGALSATGQPKFHEGFAPLVPGIKSVPFNDFNAVKTAVTDKTIAIMLELVQGEGGVHLASEEYVKQLKKLCEQRDMLLIFDEVQTGMGRTGRMFAFQSYGVQPDMMTLAKSLGGGFPIGAMVASQKLQDLFQPGTHASTFGGNPLACAAGLAAFEALEKDKLVENGHLMGQTLMRKLNELKAKQPLIKEVRGMGLLIGVELSVPSFPVYEKCLEQGLIVNATQDTVLRLAPPLTINEKEIQTALQVLDRVLKATAAEAPQTQQVKVKD